MREFEFLSFGFEGGISDFWLTFLRFTNEMDDRALLHIERFEHCYTYNRGGWYVDLFWFHVVKPK